MIGIIFAMKEELDSFINDLKINKKNKIYDLEFYEVDYLNLKLVLVLSGVGKVNAARSTQILIDNYDIKYIINAGVAGGISLDLKVLDIVVGNALIQHDFDITVFNHEKGYIPNVGTFIECDKKLVSLAKESGNVRTGVIASGDIFLTDLNMSRKINTKFQALCVEMEGASVAQVAKLCNIPFLVIRCISDNGDNKMVYEEFLENSCQVIGRYLKELLNNLSKNENIC